MITTSEWSTNSSAVMLLQYSELSAPAAGTLATPTRKDQYPIGIISVSLGPVPGVEPGGAEALLPRVEEAVADHEAVRQGHEL